MTKKQLIELWNEMDDDTEIELHCGFYKYKVGHKIKKLIIITK